MSNGLSQRMTPNLSNTDLLAAVYYSYTNNKATHNKVIFITVTVCILIHFSFFRLIWEYNQRYTRVHNKQCNGKD